MKWFVGLLVTLSVVSAQAQLAAPGHNTSPYTVTLDWASGNTNTGGKISVSATLTPGQKTAIVLLPGQSNSTNITATPYTPTNTTACQQLNIYDGTLYRAVDPLLGPTGASGGTWISRWCDKTVNAGTFQRVILVPIAASGTSSDHWVNRLNQRIYVAVLRLRALGYLDITNTDLHRFAIVQQGETDGQLGVSAAVYAANWITVQGTATALGWSGKWFFNKQTYNAGVTNATIQGAQTSAPLIDGVTRFQGADSDARVTLTNRQVDATHWNDTGADNIATDTQTIIAANY